MINQEEIKKENTMMLKKTSREEFKKFLTTLKSDNFSKTFIAKCDMMDAWDKCIGYWIGDELAGAIVVTISKKSPTVANLQLLHTFSKFRGKGIGKLLCNWALSYALEQGAKYFRVSAEFDAVEFYEKCGFKFVGRQKTAKLSMFCLTDKIISNNSFEPDEFIWKAINKKGKGSCVECYVEYQGVYKYTTN